MDVVINNRADRTWFRSRAGNEDLSKFVGNVNRSHFEFRISVDWVRWIWIKCTSFATAILKHTPQGYVEMSYEWTSHQQHNIGHNVLLYSSLNAQAFKCGFQGHNISNWKLHNIVQIRLICTFKWGIIVIALQTSNWWRTVLVRIFPLGAFSI